MHYAIERACRSLLNCGYLPIIFFTKRDVLNENPGPRQKIWDLESTKQILRKQLPQGSWRYPNARAKELNPLQDYDQLETYRCLGQLVEKCGMDRTHLAIQKAAEFLFTKQTEEGDFRGIYGKQYTPNYSAGIMELLIKAGYGNDARIGRGFRWLLAVRQSDGGWAIPLRTAKRNFRRGPTSLLNSSVPIQPDFSCPSSHMVTGVVLRAFAAHGEYRNNDVAVAAADLLVTGFFKRDAYADRGGPEYWERVSFPFWFTDIVSALDSLSLIGRAPMYNLEIENALKRLLTHQIENGLFKLKLLKSGDHLLKYWETLAITRILKRYHSLGAE
ncbi:MAG: hypothetical protein M1368_07115 [Thaumarchaeota archaeon]|nr:hypothetical protein [Nitrososphaerota archaeon]